jgi:AraC family transcriptional regulator of adaptative response/methylated-DNA-[protein]-cysteine methyltransferase
MLLIHFTIKDSPLGLILIAKTEIGICAIFLGDEKQALKDELQTRFPKSTLVSDTEEIEFLALKVIELIKNPKLNFTFPLDIKGTSFQKKIWQALMDIPPGKTFSYSQLAIQINAPKSARAVAQACATNKISILIPCHRAIRADGSLSGYRWGTERKRKLLDNEIACYSDSVVNPIASNH